MLSRRWLWTPDVLLTVVVCRVDKILALACVSMTHSMSERRAESRYTLVGSCIPYFFVVNCPTEPRLGSLSE